MTSIIIDGSHIYFFVLLYTVNYDDEKTHILLVDFDKLYAYSPFQNCFG